MKQLFLTLLLILSCHFVFAQIPTEKSLSYAFNLDTMLIPDYFEVEITVAEYWKYEGKGRKMTSSIVPLDTVSQKLQHDLAAMGFTQSLNNSSIAEKADPSANQRYYYARQLLFQITYKFNVSDK